MNDSDHYSCYDRSGLSDDSITAEYWNSNDTEYRDTALVSAIVTLCFFLVGTPSNLLILVSIVWQRLFKEPTYILLLNLAVADFLMCVLVMPFTIISGIAGEFKFGMTDIIRCRVCQLGILTFFFGLFTIYAIAFLSIDRFIFIKYALKYYRMVSWKYYAVICIFLWITCGFASALPLFGIGDLWFRIEISACSIKYFESTTITHNMSYSIFVASIVIPPLLTIFITSMWILCIIRKQMQKVYTMKKESDSTEVSSSCRFQKRLNNSKHAKQLRLLKVFGAIWISNIITWTPFLIRVFGIFIYGDIELPKRVHLLSFLCSTSFAVLHPIIEASLIPEFRRIFVKLASYFICWKCTCKSSISSNLYSYVCCIGTLCQNYLNYINTFASTVTPKSSIKSSQPF